MEGQDQALPAEAWPGDGRHRSGHRGRYYTEENIATLRAGGVLKFVAVSETSAKSMRTNVYRAFHLRPQPVRVQITVDGAEVFVRAVRGS